MTTLDQDIAAAEADESRLARENRGLTAENGRLRKQLEELLVRVGIMERIEGAKIEPPKWLREKGSGGHRGIVSMVFSDPHYGEIVKPEQVDHLNAYSPKIAEARTRRAFEKGILLARDYVAGIEYDGAVLNLPGDNLSGTIHDELLATNAETTFESLLSAIEWLEAGIRMWADEFGRVVVPCTVGNHPRQTRKPIAKNRAQDNVDWLMYRLIARDLAGDDRITMLVSDGADVRYPIYGTQFIQTHGDQFRGGSGIAGMLSPLLLGQHRKTRRETAAGHPFDWMVLGHWHSYWSGRGLIVSGSLKGTDEYSYIGNFGHEPPQLAWFVTTPENGVTLSAPVLPASRRAEGW